MPLKPHNETRPAGLVETDSVLDIGAGIRPMQWFRPRVHVCIEPHEPYAEVLRENGYQVIDKDAMQALPYLGLDALYDSVFLLDCLHTMEKDYGAMVVKFALTAARKQVVVREDHKFREDTEDHWHMGGEFWQTHRSHWTPADFEGWTIENSGKGYFAIKDIT